jgi:putative hydrolase
VDPVQALERISYLLDRDGAEPRRSLAYRNAAEVIAELPDGELARLHKAGRLTSLPGVGDSTARAIAQALDGEVPDRLRDL